MSARLDFEVKKYLDTVPREYLTRSEAENSIRHETRAARLLPSDFFALEEITREFEREEILQPRRLSLRVF